MVDVDAPDEIPPELTVSENHRKLADLMRQAGVTVDEIREIVAKKGYYPLETPLDRYDPDFVGGVLVGAWNQVFSAIQSTRNA